MVRPGGALAVATWGPGLFEPANGLFWDCVRAAEPSLFKAFNPWDEITSPEALEELFTRAGVTPASAQAVSASHSLDHSDRFWDIVLGSGYRATVDALSPEQCSTVRARLLRQLRSRQVTTVRMDVVFGTAQRPC
jgi:hypothetical protein